MAAFGYADLRFLVVDDFGSFRSTLNSMLTSLGVGQVAMAQNGAEALEVCRSRRFDVILCDYDLGPGKNGQRVLESLRHHALITRDTLFVMVSADASTQVVMAAYDCAPDDYLAKPINTQMLERRIGRLLDQRSALMPAFKAVDQQDYDAALRHLYKLVQGGRHAVAAQKCLGELLLQQDRLAEAEALYTRVLAERPLDWAKLGLAYVYQQRGQLNEAGDVFLELTEKNPLYLPAYDGLASNCYLRDNTAKLQEAIEKSVKVSPMSILRQKNLANIAEKNGDIPTALKALRDCVKLGRESCHGTWDDAYQFAMTAAAASYAVLDSDKNLPSEAMQILKEATDFFPVSPEQLLRMQFLEGRLQFIGRHTVAGREAVLKAEKTYLKSKQDVDTDIAHIKALQTIGETARADERLHQLLQFYAHDQPALQKLDALLNEPMSEANRQWVAQINREGIDLYNRGLFDESLACFERARVLFPKHVGIQMNRAQAFIGKIKAGDNDYRTRMAAEQAMAAIADLMDEGHSQYARYQKLKWLLTQ